MAWLAGAWPAIVGAKLGERTRPQKFMDGVLDVAVTGKEWRAGLEDVAAEFAGRVNEAWGGSLVKQVRFAAARAPGRRLPRSLDNEHTPFVRTGSHAKSASNSASKSVSNSASKSAADSGSGSGSNSRVGFGAGAGAGAGAGGNSRASDLDALRKARGGGGRP